MPVVDSRDLVALDRRSAAVSKYVCSEARSFTNVEVRLLATSANDALGDAQTPGPEATLATLVVLRQDAVDLVERLEVGMGIREPTYSSQFVTWCGGGGGARDRDARCVDASIGA